MRLDSVRTTATPSLPPPVAPQAARSSAAPAAPTASAPQRPFQADSFTPAATTRSAAVASTAAQGPTLRRGDTGAAVESLQNDLVKLGYMTQAQVSTGRGTFGPQTEAAVKAFQQDKGLEADGVVGPKTREALSKALAPTPPAPPPAPGTAPSLADVKAGKGMLQRGQEGQGVRDLQNLLVKAGHLTQEQMNSGPGVFGPATENAVKSFQKAQGLTPPPGMEGMVGKTTLEALEKAASRPGTGAGVTLQQLRAIMPQLSQAKAEQYLPHLNRAMAEANINTRERKAAFLAQLAHESGQFRYFEELASGRAYEGRRDLGNTQPGDGVRYKGRGPIQITGRANYRAAGRALGIDLENNPRRAADPDVGFRVAAWFWNSRNLNSLADAGNFREITRRINGGFNGLADRQAYHRRALEVL